MRNLKVYLFPLFLGLCTISFFTSCEENTIEPTPTKTGKASFEITDGPIDDASVTSAFVTIAEVKVDGKTFDGFSGKQTIDLLAYQNGNTKALGLADLEVGTYSDISLVLDYETDANGQAPGCYVLTTDGIKHELSATAMSTKEFVLNGAMTVEENEQTNIVFDFDLRKAVQYSQNSSSQSNFKFVTDTELESAIRMVNKVETGQIQGQSQQSPSFISDDKIIVYAYEKGTFDMDTETQGQGSSNVTFANATTSSVLDANGNYTLSFLKEGNYELHFFAYEDADNDGSLELKGSVQLDALTSINFNDISVEAGSTLTLDVVLMAILPL